MFTRLRLARYMKVEADANTAAVTFAGNALRIATVHQFGLRDRVNKTGLTARYPARELLGFDERDVASIAELISRTLSD